MRKSGWESGFKEEGVNGWFCKFFAVCLLQLAALSIIEVAVASGVLDTDITASIVKIDNSSKENSDLIGGGLSGPGSEAGPYAPKHKSGSLGISEGDADYTIPVNIKVASQHTGDKPATAAGAKGSGSAASSLSRMEPLRLRRAKSIAKRTRLSPWLRALMGNFRWGGLLFDQYSTSFGENKSTVSSNSYGATLDVSSMTYVWQPWFALLGGGIGTTATHNDGSKSSSTILGQRGNMVLKVFPTSRFPFTATYDRRRTDLDSGLLENGIGIESLQLSQRYHSHRNTQLSLTYDRITTTIDTEISGIPSESTKKDVNERLNFDVTRNLDKHNMRFSGRLETNYDVNTLDESKAGNLIATDSFSTKKGVLINALANYNETKNTSNFVGGKKAESTGKTEQLSGTSGYTTKNGKTSLNGNIRLFRRRDERKVIEGTGATSEKNNRQANGAVRAGFRYAVNRNTRASGSADASRELETDDPQPRYNQNLSLSYGADPLEMGKFSYTWNSSAGLSNSINPEGESTSTDGRFGHTLRRPLYSGKNTKLSTNFSQNYSISKKLRDTQQTDLPADHSLTNTASVGGSNSSGRRNINVRLTVADSRNGQAFRDFGRSDTQVINFLVNMKIRLSPVESIRGTLTSQYARKNKSGDPVEDTRSSTATLSYRHGSFLDIRGLSFISSVTVSEEAAIPYSGENEESKRLLWENRLEFIAGRLRLSALAKWEEIKNVGQGAAFVRATRSFGPRR